MHQAISAILPAAGSGTRMGGDRRKTHIQLRGKPILERTVAAFDRSPLIDTIIVVVAAEEVAIWQAIFRDGGYLKVRNVVAGGETRQQSVYRGVRQATEADIIVVHDGVRPLVTEPVLEVCIEVAFEKGAAVAAVPVKDTIKVADASGKVQTTLDRGRLWAVQTPQAFRRDWLEQAHEHAIREGLEATDDASLLEQLGYPVYLVPGDYRNLKITTPEDLLIAQLFLDQIASESTQQEGSPL